jgi:hypothetical protein
LFCTRKPPVHIPITHWDVGTGGDTSAPIMHSRAQRRWAQSWQWSHRSPAVIRLAGDVKFSPQRVRSPPPPPSEAVSLVRLSLPPQGGSVLISPRSLYMPTAPRSRRRSKPTEQALAVNQHRSGTHSNLKQAFDLAALFAWMVGSRSAPIWTPPNCLFMFYTKHL